MQTVEIRLWDDLDHKQNGDKVPADVQEEEALALVRQFEPRAKAS